jgi:hypothetical protein
MNHQTHSVGTYQLFGGYSPMIAAMEEYFRGETQVSSEEVQKIESQEAVCTNHEKKQMRIPLQLAQYIPNIPKLTQRSCKENDHVNQEELDLLKDNFHSARQQKDYSTAMLNLKKICEMSTSEAKSWKAILLFAKHHFRLLVPTICHQILSHCNNPSLQREAQLSLARFQLLAST